jgi:hypothetical protein
MKYALAVFTALLAALGWIMPDQPPIWVTSVALALVALALLAEIKLERDDQKESSKLREQVATIHSKAAAVPKFELLVNKHTVRDGQTIQLTKSGAQHPLEFTLKNTGEATARNLQVHLLAPTQLPIPHLGRHWRATGTPDVPNDVGYSPLEGVTQYTFISPADLNPQDWLGLGHGYLDTPRGPVPLKLKVSAEGGAKASWVFSVVAAA